MSGLHYCKSIVLLELGVRVTSLDFLFCPMLFEFQFNVPHFYRSNTQGIDRDSYYHRQTRDSVGIVKG